MRAAQIAWNLTPAPDIYPLVSGQDTFTSNSTYIQGDEYGNYNASGSATMSGGCKAAMWERPDKIKVIK